MRDSASNFSFDDDDCPNSLVCQKEGTQGEEEEEAGDRRNGGKH